MDDLKKQTLLCYKLLVVLTVILSCTTLIIISFLHFGQYSGKLTNTV